jgi:hypothetical protein
VRNNRVISNSILLAYVSGGERSADARNPFPRVSLSLSLVSRRIHMSGPPPPPPLPPPQSFRGGLEFAPDPSTGGARARLWVLRFMGGVGMLALVGILQARVTPGGIDREEWLWPMQRAQRERERVARLEEARVLIEQQLSAKKLAGASGSSAVSDGRKPSSSCVIC